MNIVLVMVASLDGKTTQWDIPGTISWTSPEDQAHFANLRNISKVIVMGKNTYLAAQNDIHPSPERLRIVLTNHPEQFSDQTVPNQLEFLHATPQEVISLLKGRGYNEILLVGGAQVNAEFLTAGLINELWLTIEPKIFGTGNPILSATNIEIPLQLESIKQLNAQGTLLLHYLVK